MFIEFIKSHDAGIAKGQICKVVTGFGERMIKEGYAKEVKQKSFDGHHGNEKAEPKKPVKKKESKRGRKKQLKN